MGLLELPLRLPQPDSLAYCSRKPAQIPDHSAATMRPPNPALSSKMLALEFPGSTRLVDSLTAAVCHDCPTEITDALRNTLCELIRDPEVKLPDCCYERAFDHYARRELYRSDEHGFSVIAMTWGPGQGTPIHDHAGMWCVECVVDGTMARSRSRRMN